MVVGCGCEPSQCRQVMVVVHRFDDRKKIKSHVNLHTNKKLKQWHNSSMSRIDNQEASVSSELAAMNVATPPLPLFHTPNFVPLFLNNQLLHDE